MDKMIADRYMIISSLGEGGMADVYLAIDTILNREVAVKVLRGELSNDPVTLVRFQREANAASKLNHPNVVDVYDVGEYNNRHYIVMEYVRGRTLKQLIAQRGALHKEEAVNIMLQLVSAVRHAHENNIIHRDIKPQNVLVKDDGTVKITDFGIALAHDAVQLTQNDAVLGSAHYLAPETTRGEPATNQIDIYALGIVFYELLSGSVPFKGDNPVQIAMMHLREEIPAIKEFNPTLPQSIENIIRKATVKNRKLRYQSAQEMLEDLQKCLLPEYANVEKLILLDDKEMEPTRVMDANQSPKVINEEPITISKNKQKRRIIYIMTAVIAALLLSTAGIYFSGIIDGFSYVAEVVVPNVEGMSEEEAKQALEAAGFDMAHVTFTQEMTDDIEAGKVVSISAKTNEKIKKNADVQIIISKGIYFVIENYVGKSIDEVKEIFEKNGLSIKVNEKYVQTPNSKAGIITEQSGLKANDKISPDDTTEIVFTITSAPEFNIPADIIGKTIEEAYDQLVALGAAVAKERKSTAGMSEAELKNLKKGVVVDVSPAVGELYKQQNSSWITLYYY